MRRAHNHRNVTNPMDQTLGLTIRRARVKRGETQEEVARRAGLTIAAYARIERGMADPKWTTVKSIAEALDVSLGRLDPKT